MKKLTALLICVIALCGCVNGPEINENQNKQNRTFGMNINAGQTETKTILDGHSLSWAADDCIGMFVSDADDNSILQSNAALANTATADGLKNCIFKGNLRYVGKSAENATYYAYYPYSAKALTGTYTIEGEIPVSQADNFKGAYDYMIAEPLTGKSYSEPESGEWNSGLGFTFPQEGQVMTQVRLRLPLMNSANFHTADNGTVWFNSYPYERIHKVTLMTAGEIIAGEFTLDVTNVANEPVFSQTVRSDFVNVTYTDPKVAYEVGGQSGYIYIYMTVAAVGNVQAGMRIIAETDHGQAEWTTTKAIAFNRGAVCNIPIPDWTTWTTPNNLSLHGTANCYVVKPSVITNDGNAANDVIYTYEFDATTIGNGVAYTNDSAYNGGLKSFKDVTIPVSAMSDAVLLWESDASRSANSTNVIADNAGAVTLIKDADAGTAKIQFSTGTQEGNALIALRTSAGTVIWSWHIWVTNDADNINGGSAITKGKRMMNRNLGAMHNNQGNYAGNRGMHYQWGRKDPFQPLAKDQEFDKNTQKGNGVGSWSSVTIASLTENAEKGNLQYAVEHPMAFIYSANSSAPNDWYTSTPSKSVCNYLWGGGYNSRQIVNGVETYDKNVYEVASSKTVFDPCPVGYRMPVIGAWGFERYWGIKGAGDTTYGTYGGGGEWLFNTTHKSFFYSAVTGDTNIYGVTHITEDGDTEYYPATGQIQGVGDKVWKGIGDNGRYWSATVYGPTSTGSDASQNRAWHACTTWFSNQSNKQVIQPANNWYRECIRPVRCVFEQFYSTTYASGN